jgi:hypothetical protein
MKNIFDNLIESDEHNFRESKRVLAEFDPRALQAVDEFARLLTDIGDAFGKNSDYDKHNLALNEWLRSQAGDPEKIVRSLEDSAPPDEQDITDPDQQAREHLYRANSVIARTYLILRLRRDFLFGIADLLKLRLIPALGYLRIQSESTAILALMANSPAMAVDWLNPEAGRKFYNRYHGEVVKKMRSLGIYEYYDQGSEMALHSRVHGVIPGVLVDQEANRRGEISITYQEFADPIDFLAWFGIFLQAHERLLAGIAEGFPEVSFNELNPNKYSEIAYTVAEKLKPLLQQKRREIPTS